MEFKRVHVLAVGRVQGVFFRDYTCREAERLGLTGWVRNLANGSVETEFQGTAKQVDSMLEWLSMGSPLSQVSGLDWQPVKIKAGEQEFVFRF